MTLRHRTDGFTRLMQTEGEVAGARAAARHGIPFSLSTLGTASIEEVAAANPQGRNWFQLYMWKDRCRPVDADVAHVLNRAPRERWGSTY